MRSAVVAIGDELLLGDIVNGNAAWLGERLAAVGAPVVSSFAVGDDVERIVTTLRRACDDADLVVTTGGLGPTVDDVTREAIAALAGVPLDFHDDLADGLRAKFARFGVPMPDSVLRQAYAPRGAAVLDNPVGTAPGLHLDLDGKVLLVLPGPPHELAGTLSDAVLVGLRQRTGRVVVTRTLHCAGTGESQVAELVDPALAGLLPDDVALAYLAGGGIVRVRLTCSATDEAAAHERLDPLVERAAAVLGDRVFGRDGDTLPGVVVRHLRARRETLAVAESLTAGLLGASVTSVPGSSAVFRGGVQVYATELKAQLASVPQRVLDEHGAVSVETAQAMAEGVRDRLGATWGVALTGVAGPDPQDGHPPGTLHLAVAGPHPAVRTARLPGDRERVRVLSVALALDLLRRSIAGSERRP